MNIMQRYNKIISQLREQKGSNIRQWAHEHGTSSQYYYTILLAPRLGKKSQARVDELLRELGMYEEPKD